MAATCPTEYAKPPIAKGGVPSAVNKMSQLDSSIRHEIGSVAGEVASFTSHANVRIVQG